MKLPLPATITVIGPGLLGGSLLLALKKYLPQAELRTWTRRHESLAEIEKIIPGIRASTDLSQSVHGAGLIVLCTPVESMENIATQLSRLPLADGCVITDVGSVKSSVVTRLEEIFGRTRFAVVGSHPMAGSERGGLSAAREDLFQNAACIITPTLFTQEVALNTARNLWKVVGGRVLEMQPEEHDRKIARISHLPHLAAAAVTLAALRRDSTTAECAGNGFRDATRIASGDPGLWTGIIAQNRPEIIAALEDQLGITVELLAVIRNGDDRALHQLLEEARALRDAAHQS